MSCQREQFRIDLFGFDAGHFQGTFSSLGRQIRRVFILGSDMAFANPRTRPDPFVVGVEELLYI